jgi:hypothetical protein
VEGHLVRALIEQFRSWLTRAGWVVGEYQSRPGEQDYTTDHLFRLESTQPPRGVRVEVDIRTYDFDDGWWIDQQLLGVTVRYPSRVGDGGRPPEVHLMGQEVQPPSYRQLGRVLTWFHDPLSGTLWEESPEPGDWIPPASWDPERWGAHVGLEHRWASSTDPQDMLRHLPGQPDDRKLRLVACACCRLLQTAWSNERNRLAVDTAERYALGLTPRREMKKAAKHSDLPWLAQLDPLALAQRAVANVVEALPNRGPRLAADVVRDVLGNPFRPVALRYSWLRQEGGVVRHLAQAIAAEGRYDEMGILADALEDAGCVESAILEHCRGPTPHVRGCWVLALLCPEERTR